MNKKITVMRPQGTQKTTKAKRQAVLTADDMKAFKADDLDFKPLDTDPRATKEKKEAKQPEVKVTQIPVKSFKAKHNKLRPIIGLVSAPYLLVRPLVRKGSVKGNELFDRVYHPED